MGKFDEIFGKVGNAVLKAAETTAKKSSELAEIGRLNIENAKKRDVIKKSYMEIGKLYFESCGEAGATGVYTELFDTVKQANIDIANNEARIEELKKSAPEETEEAEAWDAGDWEAEETVQQEEPSSEANSEADE